ncbi:kinase-like domain-containing protein [Lentinula detonsa]|uniref:Kinase-like domain-containing protein n=1 Tax=Lentinula detonsa TaxID=2804962 RepID=A0AA38PUK3_9AGAR|nr:kinase-like domain-containing protein [Lentinula detonsa]
MSVNKLCSTDDGDGCGQLFEKKASQGLCTKCRKLSTLQEGSAEYNAFKAYLQCAECGLAWKNFPGGICATCKKNSEPSSGEFYEQVTLEQRADVAKEQARKAHLLAVGSRLGSHKDPNSLHTTAALDVARANSTSSAADKDQVLITFSCRIKTGRSKDVIDFSAGTWGKAWERLDYLSEVRDDALATVNINWAKKEGMGLLIAEVDVRWSGNKVLMPNTAGLSVHDFIKAHTSGSEGFFYELTETKAKGEKAKKDVVPPLTVALELYIDKTAFTARKERMSMPSLKTTIMPVRKRQGTHSIFAEHSVVARAEGLTSRFVRTPRVASVEHVTTSEVTLVQARVICDSGTGLVDVSWPGEDDDTAERIGTIGDSIFSSGRTKHVYKLTIEDDLLVAKRFFNCGNGVGEVTAAENKLALISEITRLKSTAWLLQQFKDLASVKNVDISQNITVSAASLFCETNFRTSKASGLGASATDSAVWLVEPRRTKSVEKYSSTLFHPPRDDQIGITLSAFAHYVYSSDNQKLVLADIQGSLVNIGGIDTVVLFDIMHHTSEQDSGVGDFGPEGIQMFATQHKCSYMCVGLGFDIINGQIEEEEDE